MKKLTEDQIKELHESREHPLMMLANLLEETPREWVSKEATKELRQLFAQNKKLEQDAFRYRALRAYKKSDFGFASAEEMDSAADQMVDLGNPDVKQAD